VYDKILDIECSHVCLLSGKWIRNYKREKLFVKK